MVKSKKKFVVLCHGAFNYIKNKTGNMLIRYRPDEVVAIIDNMKVCLLYTSPSPRDRTRSRMPSSA